MALVADIFKQNYQHYQAELSVADLDAVQDDLGLISDSGKLILPFFNKTYLVSNTGFTDEFGEEPGYGTAVILFKYILSCPERPYFDEEWSSFKDFKKTSHFTNTNFFRSDTEQVIEKTFTGNIEALKKACAELGGIPQNMDISYDVSMRFDALPKISLLLLFNDGDEDFPPKGMVLFQKHAEHYLDPESLAMTGAWLARNLKKQAS